MMWLDIMLLAMLVLSAVYSIFRGFVREMLSLTGWVLSFWLAIKYAPQVAVWFEGSVESPGVRFVLAFMLQFIVILLASMLIARLAVRLIKWGGLRSMDRMIGAGFGLARGVIIGMLLVMLGGMSPLSSEPAWQQSRMVGVFEKLTLWASDKVPGDMVSRVREQAMW